MASWTAFPPSTLAKKELAPVDVRREMPEEMKAEMAASTASEPSSSRVVLPASLRR